VLAATVTIAPVWLYGPSSPGDASAGSQPDWYTGFLDGALRLVPSGWEFVWLGHTWTLAVLVPLGVVTAFLLTILVYPFVEEWITGDHRDHNLLDRPRNTPTRTGLGVGGLIFFFGLWGTGSTDLVATHFRLGLETVVLFYQALVVVGPIIAFIVTRRVCLALQRKDRELLVHGVETGRIVRLPGGEYIEVHRPVDAYERWRLTNTTDYRPVDIHPDERGRLTIATRVRGALSRFFFEDRIAPTAAIASPTTTAAEGRPPLPA
jgi:ubiquinol-cytochrome c reductase cytochrome b subunit